MQVYLALHEHFSKYGLLNKVNLEPSEEGGYYCYLQYYTPKAASKAR